MSEDLHIKYRPQSFDEVVGQDSVVKSIQRTLAEEGSHAFLLAGPSGVGKTTVARLIAKEVGCERDNVQEIDGATHTGVDAVRDVTSSLHYATFGRNPNKALIVDEVHAISKQAFQAMLKAIEEPPPHTYWLLCTTEPSRVPETIKTRCHVYTLSPVSYDGIFDLLASVTEKEELELPDEVVDVVAKNSEGSPRKALVYLSMCRGCNTRREASSILRTAYDTAETIDFCRIIADPKRRPKWSEVAKRIRGLETMNPESVRLSVVNYVNAALADTDDPELAAYYLEVLDAFSTPCNPSEKLAPIYLAAGSLIFGAE